MAKNGVYKLFKKVFDAVTVIFFMGMGVCVILQVLFRYLLRMPLPWTEELARFLMVIVTFMGAAVVSRKGEHLGAYFLRDRAKGRTKAVMMIISNIMVLAFLIIMVIGGIEMYGLTWNNYAVTMPWVSNGVLYIALLIGSVLMLIYTLRDLVCSIKLLISGDTDNLKSGCSSPFGEE